MRKKLTQFCINGLKRKRKRKWKRKGKSEQVGVQQTIDGFWQERNNLWYKVKNLEKFLWKAITIFLCKYKNSGEESISKWIEKT